MKQRDKNTESNWIAGIFELIQFIKKQLLMKTKFLIILLAITLFLSACKDNLDPYPYGRNTEVEAWKYQEIVAGMVFYAYERGNIMPREYRTSFNGNRLECTTDNGVFSNSDDNIEKFAKGSLLASSNAFDGIWQDGYRGIASLNSFLKDNKGYKTNYYINKNLNNLYRANLQGQAFALRGYFYWKLLQRWGGIGINSKKLLGIPLITDRLTVEDPIDQVRASYIEIMNQIQADADSAMKYFPIEANRDFLVPNVSDRDVLGGRNWGMIDKIATKAYLTEMYMTVASPLFVASDAELKNKQEDHLKKAAKYAKEVIDFKRFVDNVSSGFNVANRIDWRNTYDPSAVWVSRVQGGGTSTNTSHESDVYPANFNSNGAFGVSQDLVDAFPAANGFPINDPRSNYDPKNPYANRDMRFYSNVFYNGVKITPNKQPVYTFECWESADDGSIGKDSPGLTKVSKTGYHLKKMTYFDTDMRQSSGRKAAPMQYFNYRWAHMILIYAEAMNEVYGPTTALPADNNPLTAKDAIAFLRLAKTYDNANPSIPAADLYLNEVAGKGKDEFRKLVRNEIRIETCFEGQRYYDVRRWATNVSEINVPVHKVKVHKNTDGTFSYAYNDVVTSRNFPSLWSPIPLTDVKRGKIEQNEGWSNWQ